MEKVHERNINDSYKSLTLNYEKKPINLTRINKFTHTITKSDKKKMMIITAI